MFLLIGARLELLSVCSARSVRLSEEALMLEGVTKSNSDNFSGLEAVRRALMPKSIGSVFDIELLMEKIKESFTNLSSNTRF